jgi:hypothetical protein
MLALLIEDITLVKRREVTAAVRFRGGATTTLTLPRPLTSQQLRATHPEVRQQIDALLNEYRRENGRLKGRVCSDRGEWLYWLPDRRKNPSIRRTVTSTARGSANHAIKPAP